MLLNTCLFNGASFYLFTHLFISPSSHSSVRPPINLFIPYSILDFFNDIYNSPVYGVVIRQLASEFMQQNVESAKTVKLLMWHERPKYDHRIYQDTAVELCREVLKH
jgi:hypothetical protein